MATTSYAIALGSNRRGRHGAPAREVEAALALLGGRASRVVATRPLGPSQRRFANAAAVIDSGEAPDALLRRLKALERHFGRRATRRWGARVLDLDIILWSGGSWRSRGLAIPHVRFRERGFVLDPLAELVPGWRDPLTGRTVRQLRARLRRSRPLAR